MGGSGPTLLIGGLGRGGRGYYCLDISALSDPTFNIDTFNAESSAASLVKWEYPQAISDPENATTPIVDNDMGYSFSQAFVYALGAGAGFALALVLMAGVREKLDLANVPQLVKGTAAALIVAGVLSMAFMGFAGLG